VSFEAGACWLGAGEPKVCRDGGRWTTGGDAREAGTFDTRWLAAGAVARWLTVVDGDMGLASDGREILTDGCGWITTWEGAAGWATAGGEVMRDCGLFLGSDGWALRSRASGFAGPVGDVARGAGCGWGLILTTGAAPGRSTRPTLKSLDRWDDAGRPTTSALRSTLAGGR
jgi:hypothetical protein